jgi:pyrroline-5-carboxylate reductase
MKTIGFVGAGNMARALGGGLLRGERAQSFRLCATDPDANALERFARETGGATASGLAALAAASDLLVLAVKPQVIGPVLAELAPLRKAEHLVLSIAAGIRLQTLSSALGADARIVRAMPNTPALVGEGMSVLVAGENASQEDVATAREVLEAAGRVLVIDDEALMDAVTAVSGSGPGFVFAFAEAWLAGAEAIGLTSEQARVLVRQTLLGSATLWERSDEEVGALRAAVTSPGGTTQAGLEALASRGFATAVRAALQAAALRSRELSAGSLSKG